MSNKSTLQLASFLYTHFFSLYKVLYYSFKRRQDAFEISLLKKYIRAGNTILDIGSNIGFYTEIITQLTGASGKVHCFEPDRNNFKRLKKNTKDLDNIILNESAVSEQKGEITLYVSDLLNVDHRTYEPASYKNSYPVKTISVDEYVNGAYPVHFIKMDIQGAELLALKGMKKTIRDNPDIKILTEFWPYGFIKSGTSADEAYQYIKNLGLNVFLCKNKTLSELSAQEIAAMKTGYFDYYNVLLSMQK